MRGLGGENADKQAGKRLRSKEHDNCEHKAQQHDILFRAHHAFSISRAVVIAQNGLRARCDAAERHGDDQHKALQNGRARDQHITVRSAVFAQHDVNRDQQHIIQRDDERRRQADLHDTPQPACVQRLPRDADQRAVTEQEAKRIGRRAHLRQHGRQRGPLHPHIQQKDKHRVEHNIDRRAQHDRAHRRARKALAHHNLVHAAAEQREHRAQHIGCEIRLRIRPELLARTEGEQDRPPEHQHRDGDQH